MCNILDFDFSKRSSTNYKKLSHFCNWHKEGRCKIIIDEVFDNVEKYVSITDFKYDIGDIVETNKGKVKILNRYIKEKYKYYTCECIYDGYKFEILQGNLRRNCGCPVCSGKKAILGFNTLYDVRPDLMKYILNIEDAKKVAPNSHKKIMCRCPNCNSTRLICVGNVNKFGFSCHVCSSGISYPNKFIRYLLKQLNICFEAEKTFNWSNKKVYDVYISKYNCIIEMHGEQHYVENSHWNSLEYEQKNDAYKKEMAHSNGIKYYYEINCIETNVDYIKNSIVNSGLLDLLKVDICSINWDLIDEQCQSPIVKEACELCNKKYKPIEIAKLLDIDYTTVLKYLKKGNKLGWCDYNSKDNMGANKKSIDTRSKPIYCSTLNLYFYNATECSKYFINNIDKSFNVKTLSYCLINNNKYKDNYFYYIDKEIFNLKKKECDNGKTSIKNVFGDYFLLKK